jgi:hypothetical protein
MSSGLLVTGFFGVSVSQAVARAHKCCEPHAEHRIRKIFGPSLSNSFGSNSIPVETNSPVRGQVMVTTGMTRPLLNSTAKS